jgi:type VI secretion system protein ImpA
MTAAALERSPSLGEALHAAAEAVQQLEARVAERLASDAPDFRPLVKLVRAAVTLLPDERGGGTTDEDSGGAAGAPATSGRGLAGSVSSREDALRAIDMVCAYLERNEPTNPAPLFLRRARQLVGHNFLQLMKELAPAALPDVARMVGVDPDSVETPGPT